MLLAAPAKVNLALSVQPGVGTDGYHEVATVMCPLELHDEVRVELLPPGCGIELVCSPDPLPAGADPAQNLAWRAAEAFAEAFCVSVDVRIEVNKEIPSQAGLGGGSSDAAAVLRALAMLNCVELDDERLVRAARSLGADVAFFLERYPALLDGRGDVLRERFTPFSLPMVLVKPDAGVATGRAYAELDALATPAPSLSDLVELLRSGDAPRVPESLSNNMEPAARRIAPELDDVFAFLEAQPALVGAPLLCGSGSCVAAFMASDVDANHVAAQAQARSWWSHPTRTLA